jgi:Na+-transporting NADH:ubiquinone oxidoreductase subunit A
VTFGAPLAWADVRGGRIALPAPAAGTVVVEPPRQDRAGRITLNVTGAEVRAVGPRHTPERATADAMRGALAGGGIWPLIWSSKTGGMPPVDGSEAPGRIIVNSVVAEPFRTRGEVVLQESGERVAAGLRFLPRLLAESGVIYLVLTEPADPAIRAIRKEAEGHACIRVETAPIRYPVENPRVLCRALGRSGKRAASGEIIWVVDLQAVQAIGACMGEGIPLHERIVAVGGPGASNPGHVRARVGTRVARFLEAADLAEANCVLRGGLLRGRPAGPDTSVGCADDAFFVLPRQAQREFFGFVNPGFDRVSIVPCFASLLTGAADRNLTMTLRGERRPCIACGVCEDVCPAALLPQVLHRLLYAGEAEEAEALGLDTCVDCGLCSYICPSKIELVQQFGEAKAKLAAERSHAQPPEQSQSREGAGGTRDKP